MARIVGFALLCLLLTPGLAGGTPEAWEAADGVPSFRNEVLPALTKAGCNSGPCHGALAGKNGFRLSLRAYDPEADYHALTREALGRRTVRSAPAQSPVLLKATGLVAHGGGRRFALDSPEYRIIADWIASGAPAPSESDPVIRELRVAPERHLIPVPGETVELKVEALYSDGRVRDVTYWTLFSSSNDAVATVDRLGRVTTRGPGEAAIAVWFDSHVSLARVAVPHPREVDPEIFQRAPRHNFVDDLVLRKLEELHIEPSGAADDATFIRRLFLDTLGVLPTRREVEAFLADPAPDKREVLVKAVLEREEFVDYWSYRWSDLFLVSSRKLSPAAMQAYYGWIRESVAENKPWDRMVYELLTARGSTLENGAGNYWVIHKDPVEITENLTQSFLGVSLSCARCHNHPLEKWTQDQYYGMASLVSRVSLKNGVLPGEMTILPRPLGDLPHPRRGHPMPPQPLDGEPLSLTGGEDRREHLARWLTSPENVAFARTVVNRVWANFFGRGLVEPVDDLRATNPASNEDLLAALTGDFVESGFDLRHLIRTILVSATYQRSSETRPGNAQEELYLSRYPIRRLPAEVVLDAVSQVTGIPEEFSGYPPGTRAMQLPDTRVESYFLDSFGRPPRITVDAGERMNDANLAQALHLLNGETLNRRLRQSGSVVDRLMEENGSTAELLKDVYLTVFSRQPTGEEAAGLQAVLGRKPGREALEDLMWALLTSKEFLFTH